MLYLFIYFYDLANLRTSSFRLLLDLITNSFFLKRSNFQCICCLEIVFLFIWEGREDLSPVPLSIFMWG